MHIELHITDPSLAMLVAVAAAADSVVEGKKKPEAVTTDKQVIKGDGAEAVAEVLLSDETAEATTTEDKVEAKPEGKIPPPPVDKIPPPPAEKKAPPAPGNEPAQKLDSSGHPWDERIHGGGKTFYEKSGPNGLAGTWKLKRGADKALVDSVRAEAAEANPAAVLGTTGVDGEEALAAIRENADPVVNYATITQKVTEGIVNGSINPLKVGELWKGLGLTGMPELATRPELFDAADKAVDELTVAPAA